MPTLLLVDDSPAERRRLRELTAGHYTVVGEASGGAEGVRLYREVRPDLVVLDIVMPEMDGIEALRGILRADPAARVVMAGASGQEGLVMEALVAGAREYVAKPVDAGNLLRALAAAAAG